MKSIQFVTSFLLLFASLTFAQKKYQIQGFFPKAKEIEIRLKGVYGIKDTILSQTKTDEFGKFSLEYSEKYKGVATLQLKDVTNIIVILNKENFKINWTDFKDIATVQFSDTQENQIFNQAFQLNALVQQKLAGLKYLLPLYNKEATNKELIKILDNEIKLQSNKFDEYTNQLSNLLYVKDYLKNRYILQKLQQENKTKEEETAAENNFLSLDFSSENLYHSSLIKELFDEYLKQVLKLDNIEEINLKLNLFSAVIKKKTSTTPILLNEYSEYLIKQYEKFGLPKAAEYFALLLLDDTKCTIDEKRIPLLEQYKKMALGNTAPNVEFTETTKFKSLYEIPSKYKVVLFGASWCEECKKEIPLTKEYAEIFKTKYDAEIIFISLDANVESFTNFTKELPIVSSCDYKGWESQSVKNYYVFATPAIFILDDNNRIVAKPNNVIDTAKWLYEKNK